MPRPRSRDKVLPITIGLPMSLHHRLENHISYTSSRSKWVKSAIISKLDDQFDYDSLSSRFLIRELQMRNIISTELLTSLMMRVEEIEAEQ